MTISIENVKAKFKLYSGEPLDGTDQARDALCMELCTEGAAWVTRRVKPEILEAETFAGAGALESLAAAEAFWQLAALDQSSAPQGVSSSGMKLESGDRLGPAKRLRDEKEAACAGMLAEDGFYFGAT